MMNYEEFKIAMTAQVTTIAGEEVNVSLHQVPKNNGVILDAITIMHCEQNAAPTIYLKDFYLRYCQGCTLEELAEELVEFAVQSNIRGRIPAQFFMDFPQVKKRICYKLVNYKKNERFLQTVPHKRVLDLAMVYYYSVDPVVMEHATVLIRHMDIMRWHITAEEVERAAIENTPKLLTWKISTMAELMQEILDWEMEEDETNPFRISIEEKEPMPMYVLTNKEKYFGAACIFYPDVLKQISEKLEDNLYILPSSIHECIIIPASGEYTRKSLSEMVTEINGTQVEETEVLSDYVYYYDRWKEKISM